MHKQQFANTHAKMHKPKLPESLQLLLPSMYKVHTLPQVVVGSHCIKSNITVTTNSLDSIQLASPKSQQFLQRSTNVQRLSEAYLQCTQPYEQET